MLSSRPCVRLGKGLQERLNPRNVKVVHSVYSSYRDSLGDGNQCGGHIRNLAFERVARFLPLYPQGNINLIVPFGGEILTWFDDTR